MSDDPQRHLREHFPGLYHPPDPALATVLAETRLAHLRPAAQAFGCGAPCQAYVLVVAGSIRVRLLGRGGREVLLYRVAAGEPCILTTSCLLAHRHYPAEGVVEEDTRLLALPAPAFHRGLAVSDTFRRFVFSSFGERLADLLERIDEVAFERVESRLARALLRRAGGHTTVAVTHQDLAAELGTAREVVSRELRRLQDRGFIAQARGRITLLDPDAITAMASPAGTR